MIKKCFNNLHALCLQRSVMALEMYLNLISDLTISLDLTIDDHKELNDKVHETIKTNQKLLDDIRNIIRG